MVQSSTASDTPSESKVHVFGIRHHGPGSARSLSLALRSLAPDIVLIEGPPDAADDLLQFVSHAEMTPPVSLLIYDPADPKNAVYYPFAEFSPEWQALIYAQQARVQARFIDLPQTYHFALDKAEIAAENEDEIPEDAEQAPLIRLDPLSVLAQLSGDEDADGERWWERMVEHRHSENPQELFAAVLEAMSVLREGMPPVISPRGQLREDMREAHMRQQIRDALQQGFKKIAVVCGAWHAPVLGFDSLADTAKDDTALLRKLPRGVQVSSTWVPWTYQRLTTASGYGAGVRSPGWYEYLWQTRAGSATNVPATNIAIGWMIRVANLLRHEGIDASSANVIEAVRLAECVASLRGLTIPGLTELNESTQTVLCFGQDAPIKLISSELIVGNKLGAVPAETPSTPLQQDLRAQQKRLRLAPDPAQKVLDFDLRNENDLSRSHLLHRLNMLDVAWGVVDKRSSGLGTFHEYWRLQWAPEMEVSLIAAGVWGSTIERAASAKCESEAKQAQTLPPITKLLDQVMLADLPDAAKSVMQCLSDQAAVSSDPLELMNALPKLVNVLRYGDVRQTDSDSIKHIIDGLLVRICVGLAGACASLDDDAASAMYTAIVETNAAVHRIQDVEYEAMWRQALIVVADLSGVHGLVAGRAIRILYDEKTLEPDEVNRRMNLALSTASEPAIAAAWVDGFLRDSGTILAHDSSLLSVIDQWVTQLHPDHFQAVLPLVRRTFSTFTSPDRRTVGEQLVKRGKPVEPSKNVTAADPAKPTPPVVLPSVFMMLRGAPPAKKPDEESQ